MNQRPDYLTSTLGETRQGQKVLRNTYLSLLQIFGVLNDD
jgi:hypothetical protein